MTRRTPRLTSQDVLALRAATEEMPRSMQAWQQLNELTPFDEIEVNTQRIAPAIYANVEKAGAFADRDRLRGTYKHSWSRNTRSFHAMAPVAQELSMHKINYRLIKGAAIQLTLGRVGPRIMGDIDIVVSEKDVESVHQSLLSHGFTPNFNSPCAAFHDGTPRDALNYNNGSCHIDVHIAEHKDPTRLYTHMLDSDPFDIEYGETHYLVADPTLLLLTAATHGQRNFGPTDLIQACTDVSLLSQKTSPSLIRRQATQTDTELDVDYMFRILDSAGLDRFSDEFAHQFYVSGLRAGVIHMRQGVRRLNLKIFTLHRLARKFQERRLSLFEINNAWRQFHGRRVRYLGWLITGRSSPVERLLLRRKRTFLQAPQEVLVIPCTAHPFQDHSNPEIAANRISTAVKDWRFTIELDEPQQVLTLTLDSSYFDRFDANLFWMGMHHVRIVSGDRSMLHVVFRDVPRINEFSIRPTLQLCDDCSKSLDSLQVVFDKG